MKRRDRYSLLIHAKRDYSDKFRCDYQFKSLSKRHLYKLLKDNKHSTMCEWWYCCHGLYSNCWQEPFEAGCWHDTQKEVDDAIRGAIDCTAKICRKDNRILYCQDEYGTHVIIISRDVLKCDFLICFTNQENC